MVGFVVCQFSLTTDMVSVVKSLLLKTDEGSLSIDLSGWLWFSRYRRVLIACGSLIGISNYSAKIRHANLVCVTLSTWVVVVGFRANKKLDWKRVEGRFFELLLVWFRLEFLEQQMPHR